MKITLRSAVKALFTVAALGGIVAPPIAADAQRNRDWRNDDSRYGNGRYDNGRYDSDRYGSDRYGNGRYGNGRYGDSRESWESVRRLVDRAESASNTFREVFERYERDQDRYDDRDRRDDRDWRNDRYRNDRYRNDRGRYGRDLSYIKPYVQRMDEGLERLRGETDHRDRYSDARSVMADIMRSARMVDRDLGSGRSGGTQMNALWFRLRSELNALAGAFGVQRI